MKLRSETGTLQLGRLEDSPPPPCRKGLHFLADTLPFVHPDPLPQSRGAVPESMLLVAHLPPALGLAGFQTSTLSPSLFLQIIGKYQDIHSGSRLRDRQQQALTSALSLSLCPCMGWGSGNLPILSQGRVLVFSYVRSHPQTSFFLAKLSHNFPVQQLLLTLAL